MKEKHWRDKLFDIAEKYCDHDNLKGKCLYHIFEKFIEQILKKESYAKNYRNKILPR